MPVYGQIRPNLYRDSVALMRIAETLAAGPGVRQATLLMGSAANKEILAAAGLLAAALEGAKPDDLMVVVEADTTEGFAAAEREIDRLLQGEPAPDEGGSRPAAPRSLALARQKQPAANLAMISVPGPYAAAEALKALRLGLNVFLFSDNVPVAAERRLKELAAPKGLLLMGPDCGTAILDGVPLGFANRVRRGGIGIVAASGTGLQEVSTGIDRRGGGVSQAIGTGGRDLDDRIGGITTLSALRRLGEDPLTAVVVVLSKPPGAAVAPRVEQALRDLGKPAILLLLGAAEGTADGAGLHRVPDLDAAAAMAVRLAGMGDGTPDPAADAVLAAGERRRHAPGQRHLRGLYTGGTYALEAQLIWQRAGLPVRSNAPLAPGLALADAQRSEGHAAIDLGDDSFTVGRPHPIIDLAPRRARLLAEAADPTVAAVVLDIVIGAGAHPDPAGALGPAIREAKAVAAAAGRHLTVVAWVCGTEGDAQGLARQRAVLATSGALVAPGSSAAARLAALCVGAGEPA